MDYSKISDFEINKRVALALGYRLYKDGSSNQKNRVSVADYGKCGAISMEWCNNLGNAWPIVVSNRIGISPGTATDKWAAHHGDWDIAIADTNPLRAAMIVFLMMQESKKKPS